MAVPIRSQQYHDSVAAKRRHRVWFTRGILVMVALGALGAAGHGISRMHISIPWSQADATPTPDGTPVAVGTWCSGETCRFFDRSGAQWGAALQSSGPLLLLVQDRRASESALAPLARGIITAADALPTMGLAARRVDLSDDQPGVVITTTKTYPLLIDALGDVTDQMATLRVFLADRAKDPAFAPAYIDLRTPGRVYYK